MVKFVFFNKELIFVILLEKLFVFLWGVLEKLLL